MLGEHTVGVRRAYTWGGGGGEGVHTPGGGGGGAVQLHTPTQRSFCLFPLHILLHAAVTKILFGAKIWIRMMPNVIAFL